MEIRPIGKQKKSIKGGSMLVGSVTNESVFIAAESAGPESKSPAGLHDFSLETKSSIPQFLNLKKSIQAPTVDEIK